MKNLSVSTYLHILFSIVISILVVTFMLFLSWNEDRYKIDEYKRYQLISITFLSKLQLSPDKDKLSKFYQDLRVKKIEDKNLDALKKKIVTEGKTVFTGGSAVGQVRVFDIEGKHYIYVQRMKYNLLLEDVREKKYYFEIAVSLGFFLVGLILLLYVAILKKLHPLKELYQKIDRFAKGDMTTRISYVYDDEIGRIAKSFDNAIVSINELSASKNLFMRNMMHELKTPITKGRIIVEMLEDEMTKEVLVRAFERMNELISELSQLERVTTKSFEPQLEYILLSDILQESQKLLMTSPSCVKIEIEDVALATDKKLMALVIKNLADNGIKYGTSKCVCISNNKDRINIISEGEALKHELGYYTEPFSQEEKRSSGFGLGLYIVYNILTKLEYILEYEHKKGKNIFTISPYKKLIV